MDRFSEPPATAPCPRCGALTREDGQFTTEMALYGRPQRRFICAAGHSIYRGMEGVERTVRPSLLARTGRGRAVAKVCRWCLEPFEGSTQQQYCGPICTRAQDAERTRQRTTTRRQAVTAAALTQLRAITPWRRRSSPVAYAARPKNLSKAWV